MSESFTYLTLKWTCKFSSVLNMCDGGYHNERSADAKPKRFWYTGKIPGVRDYIHHHGDAIMTSPEISFLHTCKTKYKRRKTFEHKIHKVL